jgi:hypothetical protein
VSMTVDQIKAAIAADSALQALADARDVDALVTALSAGRTRYVAREVGNGTVLEVLGLSVGNALLDLIQTQLTYRHVKPLLEQGRLRLDSAMVRATLQQLVGVEIAAGVTFEQQHADALVSLAQVPDPVDRTAVWVAITDGRLE